MVRFTLRQLAYFVAAAEHGSVAEAARALNVSQPSVSAAIAKLEDVLGVQLLIRHHAQGVTPTPTGRRMVAEARSLLAHGQELEAGARALGDSVRGRLEVACFVTLAPLYLPNLLLRFAEAYPDVDFGLHEAYQERLLEGLASGTFDVALMYAIDLPDWVVTRPLAELAPYALLPAGHPLAQGDTVRLAGLAVEPMILLDQPPSRQYFTRLFHAAGLEPRVRFHSPSLETVRGLVGNGHGYSVLVTRPQGDVTYDGRPIAVRAIADPVEPSMLVLARAEAARPTRLAQAFGDFAAGYFATVHGAPG